MIKIRKLTEKDKPKLDKMIEKIEKNLIDKEWWLPIQEKAYENFFNEEWTIFIGAFSGEKLIGASALFLNKFEYAESVSYLDIKNKNIAEIGRCMVLPDYRNKNLMYKMNKKIIKIAYEKGIEYLISTAHPNNISSCKSLEKLGMQVVGKINKYDNYERNIFLRKL